MAKARIAILEDDTTLASALRAAFERAGFEAYTTAREDEILDYLKAHPVNTLFVDCLLPTGSGVDFAARVRQDYPASVLDIVLMSGLFTDSPFIKESLRTADANAFLKKPFDLQEAIAAVKIKETVAKNQAETSPRRQLYLLFNKPKVSVRDKRKAIEALEDIHGFDLPFLYSLMVETQATGHLNIAGANNELLGISFSQGKIVTVDIVDEETQIGKLLIEAGFILPEDLEKGLATTSPKRIGQRLIQGNLLSPHAFDVGLANQMSIRLSRTIIDSPIRVNFVATDVELTNPHIDSERLSTFLHDWIASKISADWLKAHYTQWGDYTLLKAPQFDESHAVLKMPLVSHFDGFIDHFTSGRSLNQLLDAKKFPEETALKALHLVLTKGLLIFGERATILDPNERLTALKKMHKQLVGKNKLETWDLMTQIAGLTESEPQLIYAEFKKVLGAPPEANMAVKAPAELVKVYKDLLKIGEEAFHIHQTGGRDQMKEQMEREAFEGKMKASHLFEEAKQALHRSQYAQAAGLLQKASELDPKLPKLRLHILWAKLGPLDPQAVKTQSLRDIEMELLQIPPEEKYDAIYSFVMGLVNKAKGDFVAAKKLFEKAFNMDNTLMIARREIASLGTRGPVKKDSDLKDIVAGFFKRR